MKRTIKLRESELKRMIAESVRRVLKEAAYDMNSPEYRQMYDSGGWDNDEDDVTSNEIRDYEALPDNARHPYGADIPDFENRKELRKTQGYLGNHYGDKLASKEPGGIYKKQQDKREEELYITKRYKTAMRDFPFSLEYLRDKHGIDDPRTLPKDVIVKAYDNWKDKQLEKQRESEYYL